MDIETFLNDISVRLKQFEDRNLWKLSEAALRRVKDEYEEFERTEYLKPLHEYMNGGRTSEEGRELERMREALNLSQRTKDLRQKYQSYLYRAENGEFRSKEPWNKLS